jgi:hypothetical protein
MSMDDILAAVRSFDGVLELAPAEGGPFPEVAWGDHFFYWAPDGEVPRNVQPYATIVTKDYPDDSTSRLDPPDRYRVNVHVGKQRFAELTSSNAHLDPSEADVILPHPLYAPLGWIAVVNPGERTLPVVLELLQGAHDDERRRAERRAEA